MLVKKEMSDDNCIIKRKEKAAKNKIGKAPKDLRVRWKAWLVDFKDGAVGGSAAAAKAIPRDLLFV